MFVSFKLILINKLICHFQKVQKIKCLIDCLLRELSYLETLLDYYYTVPSMHCIKVKHTVVMYITHKDSNLMR